MKADDHHKKGLEHAKKKAYEKAVLSYTKAIELKPGEPEFYSDRAVAYFHLDQGQRSLEDMNKAQELQPEHGYRYSSRAFIKDHLGDLDGAIEDYKIAIRIDPDDAISHNNLGLLEEKKGYVQRSKERFVRADQLADGEKEQIKRGETPDRWKENGKSSGSTAPASEEHGERPEPLVQEPPKRPGWKGILGEMLRILSSRSEFRKFLSFVRSGWRRRT